MITIKEYTTESGAFPFEEWFNALDAESAKRVSMALIRMEQGLTGNMKSVGDGVSEYKIDHGAGYRVYFAKDGQKLIILLAGGTKKKQQQDIERAKGYWQDYKKRKKLGER